MRDALKTSHWQEYSPTDALRILVAACEPVAGYLTLRYVQGQSFETRKSVAEWREINSEIEEIFLRRQRAGEFRTDVTAGWLTEAFFSLVSGAGWSVQHGRGTKQKSCG
ncbi:hypothetical protein MMEU_1024 [Mycobacterium marinum str. Europe]|nr:hypothetical protein MMEU_1024 [Mycobacterium marinum str. Europe]